MRVVDQGEKSNPDEKDPHNIPQSIRDVLKKQQELSAKGPAPVNALLNTEALPEGIMSPRPPQFGAQAASTDTARSDAVFKEKLRTSTASPVVEAPALEEPPRMRQDLKTRPSFPKDKLGPEWKRVDFPSNLVPYKGVAEIYLRPFEVADLEAIYDSIQTNNSSGYFDALDQCISMDIRDLTVPDFIYMQYWLRMSSYTKSPFLISWTSRYGENLEETLSTTNLQTIMLDMTREEYADWEAQGIVFPTLRDSEYILESIPDNPEPNTPQKDDWIMQNAQYIYLTPEELKQGRVMEQKIAKLRSNKDPDILASIQEFARISEHGVIEMIETTNKQFDPVKAIVFLRDQAKSLQTLARGVADENEAIEQTAGILQLLNASEEFIEEAKQIEDTLARGEEYLPRKENIALRQIQSMDMFPTPSTKKTTRPTA